MLKSIGPQSLFGRLVLVMLLGLGLALAATVYINSAERDQILVRAGGMRLAQQIADIVKLLDSLPPEDRRKVTAVFDAPPLAVSLDRAGVSPGDSADFQTSMFATLLRYELGVDRPVSITRDAARPAFGPPAERRGMMAYGMRGPGPGPGFAPRARAFVVQVALTDGTRATFNSVLSPQDASMPQRLALTLVVLLACVVALSLVAVRWATAPLATLAGAAEALGRDINRAPLSETGPVEVRRAAAAFNAMQARLSAFLSERARVLGAISHDLKTPITRMRLRTEMLGDEGVRAKFEKDLEEMQSLVSQALDFMRDASATEPVQAVDLMALLESLQADFSDAGGKVELSGSLANPYRGRPLALRRCLSNLVDNAIRYGGNAAVSVEDTASRVTIRVCDRGPGLAPDQLELAFEPFFRGESSRSRETGGTGLGLSIARNIARSHGGDLLLRNRESGGLEAVLTLSRTHFPVGGA